MRKIQRNFDNSAKLINAIKTANMKKQSSSPKKWRELIDKFANVHIDKINQKINSLTNIQRKAIQEQRKYE